jgi:hypothetical protein
MMLACFLDESDYFQRRIHYGCGRTEVNLFKSLLFILHHPHTAQVHGGATFTAILPIAGLARQGSSKHSKVADEDFTYSP